MGTHLKADKDYKMGRKRIEIPQECLDLLGTCTDAKLSSMYGVSYQTLRYRRIEMGIPKFTQQLTQQYIDLLGKMKDTQISRLSGVSYGRVCAIRNEKGIPRYRIPRDFERNITDLEPKYPGIGRRLGHDTDASIARDYSISRERVRQFRVSLGISKAEIKNEIETLSRVDRKYLDDNLGFINDRKLGEELKIPGVLVGRYRRIRKVNSVGKNKRELVLGQKHRMGIDSDAVIARHLNVYTNMVRTIRLELGIKANPKHAPRWGTEAIRDNRKKKLTEMFYTGASDEEMSEELGLCVGYIATLRSGLGLRRREARGGRTKMASNE
mgnify:FL=1